METPSPILSPSPTSARSRLNSQQLEMVGSGIGAVQGYMSTPELSPSSSPPPQVGLESGGLPIPLLHLSQWMFQKDLSQAEYLAAQQRTTVRTNGRLFGSARDIVNKELATLGPVLAPSSVNEESPEVRAPEGSQNTYVSYQQDFTGKWVYMPQLNRCNVVTSRFGAI